MAKTAGSGLRFSGAPRAGRRWPWRLVLAEGIETEEEALAVLKPGQWSDLISRLRELDNPVVPTKPSKYALPAGKHRRSSDAHAGE